jgi:hypothetical protein
VFALLALWKRRIIYEAPKFSLNIEISAHATTIVIDII